jgi:hypothetical protein
MRIDLSAIKKAMALAAPFVPYVSQAQTAFTLIESAYQGAKGSDKKAAFDAISDAALEAAAPWLSDAKAQEIRDTRSAWVDAAAAAQKAVAAEEAARAKMAALVASFRAPDAQADATGHP